MAGCSRQVYIHIGWATKGRQPTIPVALERAVHRVLRTGAIKLSCQIVCANGTADHLHVLVQLAATIALSRLVNQLKGVTSYFINENRPIKSPELFRWQDGYGAFSVATNQIQRVAEHIANQMQHHELG